MYGLDGILISSIPMNISRRTFLKAVSLATAGTASGCVSASPRPAPVLVNDVHTQLNPTYVRSVTPVNSLAGLRKVIRQAHNDNRPVSIAGGRHAAGGQQFGTDVELIDTRQLRRVLHFDPTAGTIEVETGIQWPEFMGFLQKTRDGHTPAWTVAQKQTGTDRLSIGGALSANAHGRGLSLPPFISNVQSIVLIDANGNCHTCSRHENPELFKLAIGGYGMFGFVYSAKLQLVPLRKVRRDVRLIQVPDLPSTIRDLVQKGFLYGDFQFAIDSKSEDFLNRGILTAYEPVPDFTPMPADQKRFSEEDWKMLIYLAHTDPSKAFTVYSNLCLSTSGQICTSESQYISDYFDNYHRDLDIRMGAPQPATEVLSELYVPLDSLPQFMSDARESLRRTDAPALIYGSVRFIEKDTESFLPWANHRSACVILNLHTPHTPEGLELTRNAFRRLIDLAIRYNGSYYLTYHRYATREQVLACYPRFPELLRMKLKYDPSEQFQSDWYRHYKKLFA
jgi:FAD/FMN-containing dehydrogenase